MSKKKIKWNNLDNPDEWIEKNLDYFCEPWNAKIKKGLCKERKRIATTDTHRFSVGDGWHFITFKSCLDCKGAIPLSKTKKEIPMSEELKNQYLKELFPGEPVPVKKVSQSEVKIGDPCVCERCGNQFGAWLRGRMMIRKVCKNCVGKKYEPVFIDANTVHIDKEMIQIPDPEKILEAKLEDKVVVNNMEGYEESTHWISILFENEERLLEQVREEARLQRRDLKNHILFILEKEVEI